MRVLDRSTALAAGGWDPRYAVALVVATHDGVGAALIDTNGDGGSIDLDCYTLGADGHWVEGPSGGPHDEDDMGGSADLVAIWGRAAPGTPIDVDYLGERRTTVADAAGWWMAVARAVGDATPFLVTGA